MRFVVSSSSLGLVFLKFFFGLVGSGFVAFESSTKWVRRLFDGFATCVMNLFVVGEWDRSRSWRHNNPGSSSNSSSSWWWTRHAVLYCGNYRFVFWFALATFVGAACLLVVFKRIGYFHTREEMYLRAQERKNRRDVPKSSKKGSGNWKQVCVCVCVCLFWACWEMQHIWDEVGESDSDRDKMLLQLEQECLEVYRRKVDHASHGRAQLHQELANAEAEFAALFSALGESPVSLRVSFPTPPSQNASSFLGPAIVSLLRRRGNFMLQTMCTCWKKKTHSQLLCWLWLRDKWACNDCRISAEERWRNSWPS